MRLLILGTGSMAKQHARQFAGIEGVELAAGVDTNSERLTAFCAQHGIERGFTSLQEAFAWGDFDAVANVTPDAVHYSTTMACLSAGKHVFCEKPLATNHADAAEMADAAERSGLVAMVNLTYRNVAGLHAARDLVMAGEIGALKHVEASYLQSWLVSKAWGDWRTGPQWLWRLSTAHGSNGTLGDIGIHILDFASFGAGAEIENVFCRLKTFRKAEGDRIGDYVLDANDSLAMTVELSNGALGVVHATRWAPGHHNELHLRMYGDKGGIELTSASHSSVLRLCSGEDIETATWREIATPPVITNYQRFAEAVARGVGDEPSFRRAANLQRVLDLGAASEVERREQQTAMPVAAQDVMAV